MSRKNRQQRRSARATSAPSAADTAGRTTRGRLARWAIPVGVAAMSVAVAMALAGHFAGTGPGSLGDPLILLGVFLGLAAVGCFLLAAVAGPFDGGEGGGGGGAAPTGDGDGGDGGGDLGGFGGFGGGDGGF